MPLDVESLGPCLERIAKIGGAAAQQARQILQQVHDEGERLAEEGLADSYIVAAQRLSDQVRVQARAERLDALRNAAARQGLKARAPVDIGGAAAADRLRGKLVWQPGAGDPKDNVQALSRWKAREWASALWARGTAEGWTRALGSPAMFRDIARAVAEKRGAAMAEGQEPTALARKIADAIVPVQEAVRTELNAAGARIADAGDWFATTMHDPYWMLRGGRGEAAVDRRSFRQRLPALAGLPLAERGALKEQIAQGLHDQAFERWWGFVKPRLSERTFEDLERGIETEDEARDRFGRSVFDALVTGLHMTSGATLAKDAFLSEGYKEFLPARFEGGGNAIAAKLSEGRLLFWRDHEAWADYMERYGAARQWHALMERAIAKGARSYALMSHLGPNAAGNLELAARSIAEDFRRAGNTAGATAFLANVRGRNLVKPALDDILKSLDGRANLPQNEMFARIGATARMLNDMHLLGSVGLTHLFSLPATFPSEARLQDAGIFSALATLAQNLARPFAKGSPERLRALEGLGAYGDGWARIAVDPFAHGNSVPGYVAATHSRFMRATGISYLVDHAKSAMTEALAAVRGRDVARDFAELGAHAQNELQGYGIGPQEWTLLRQATHLEANGRRYLTPQSAQSIPTGAALSYLHARGAVDKATKAADADALLQQLRRDLGDRLGMYYADAADRATVTGGAREQALLRGAMRPGSLGREATSAFMQYRTWSIAAAHQLVVRQLYDTLSRRDAVWGIAGIMTGAMLGGYLRMLTRDLAYGDEPRVPHSFGDAAKIGLAALAQGGGLGIFGDWLFGEVDRMGASTGASFGGPMTETASRLLNLYYRFQHDLGQGRPLDFWPELARLGIDQVPFAGLFYLRGAANYLLLFHIYDTLHPGWWERANRRMQREQGRQMIGYRPGAGVPWGVPPFLSAAR